MLDILHELRKKGRAGFKAKARLIFLKE